MAWNPQITVPYLGARQMNLAGYLKVVVGGNVVEMSEAKFPQVVRIENSI